MLLKRLTLAAVASLLVLTTLPAVAQDAEDAGPAILSVTVTPATIRTGTPVTAMVLTTPDVVSVQGHVASFKFNVPKVADGSFSGTATVPRWASIFFHGLFHVHFVARTSAGRQAEAVSDVRINA